MPAAKPDDNSHFVETLRAAEPYARELERLVALKPTQWKVPDLTA